jgi:eukaryotic-like serine/threonine-protein kinase
MIRLQQALSGRYVVEEPLGRGGMAQVYRATDTVLGRSVAVKVLADHYARDEPTVARFRREAQAAARLNHPGIVAVFDTGSDDDVHYIVMELVEGRTLADVLAEPGRLQPEEAARIAADVADALAFAHAAGFVHRDVKPGNVMLTAAGAVKVMDFGIARAMSGDTFTQTQSVFGTASYLSPEQARGERVDQRSDVYSLGVVLYEMLAGRRPFEGDSAVSIAYKHVSEEPAPLGEVAPEVPPALGAIAERAMAKSPDRRYATAQAMAADLRRAAAGSPGALLEAESTERVDPTATAVLPAAVPVSPGPAELLPARRGRSWVAWLVAAVVVAGLLAVGLLAPRLGNGPATTTPKHRHTTHAPSPPPTRASPTPTATPTPSPTPTTESPSPTDSASASPSPSASGSLLPSISITVPTSFGDGVAQVNDTMQRAVTDGSMDPHTADEIGHELDAAAREADKGDVDKTLEHLDHAAQKLGDAVERGDVTPEAARPILGALQALAVFVHDTAGGDGEGDGGH